MSSLVHTSILLVVGLNPPKKGKNGFTKALKRQKGKPLTKLTL